MIETSLFLYVLLIIIICMCIMVNFAEPMLTVGSFKPVMWDDNWTVVTEDGSLSAQFEHTILITEDGAEILTMC